jgi:hypothetical protein
MHQKVVVTHAKMAASTGSAKFRASRKTEMSEVVKGSLFGFLEEAGAALYAA